MSNLKVSTIRRILSRAVDLIEEGGWSRGLPATSADGERGYSPLDRRARAFSAQGALERAAAYCVRRAPEGRDLALERFHALATAQIVLAAFIPRPARMQAPTGFEGAGRLIESWNTFRAAGGAEVVDTLRRAAESLHD